MEVKFAYNLLKEAQKDCENKGLTSFAERLEKVSRKIFVEMQRQDFSRKNGR
jgi:hypothetical protein